MPSRASRYPHPTYTTHASQQAPEGDDARFLRQGGQVGAHETLREAADLVHLHVFVQPHAPGVDFQYLPAALLIRVVYRRSSKRDCTLPSF